MWGACPVCGNQRHWPQFSAIPLGYQQTADCDVCESRLLVSRRNVSLNRLAVGLLLGAIVLGASEASLATPLALVCLRAAGGLTLAGRFGPRLEEAV